MKHEIRFKTRIKIKKVVSIFGVRKKDEMYREEDESFKVAHTIVPHHPSPHPPPPSTGRAEVKGSHVYSRTTRLTTARHVYCSTYETT